MADTLSFQDAEKIIRENPKEADALAFEYREFLKTHPEGLTADAPKSVLDGKTISEAYYYLRDQHEDQQIRDTGGIDTSNIPTALAAVPILAASFLARPKIMQEDRDYQKIEEKLKKEWLEKNPGKDFSSKEGLDYLHGSIPFDPLRTGAGEDLRAEEKWEGAWAKSVGANLPKTPTLSYDAEKEFRSNPKFKKRIERYDKEAKKIYKKPQDDPAWQLHHGQQEANQRILALRSQDEVINNGIIRGVGEKQDEEFAQKYPEKAKAYFEKKEPAPDTNISEETYVSQENPSYVVSASPQTESQGSQPSQPSRPSAGGVSRGINTINNFARRGLTNPFGKIGQRVAAQTALRGFAAFLATNPWVWLVLGIAILFIVVFVIVFSGFSGGIPGAPTTEPTPTIAPTETTTPTPAVP